MATGMLHYPLTHVKATKCCVSAADGNGNRHSQLNVFKVTLGQVTTLGKSSHVDAATRITLLIVRNS